LSATGDSGSNTEPFVGLASNTITIDIPEVPTHTWPTCTKEDRDHHLFDYRKYLFDLDKLPLTPQIEYRMKVCRELIKDIG